MRKNEGRRMIIKKTQKETWWLPPQPPLITMEVITADYR